MAKAAISAAENVRRTNRETANRCGSGLLTTSGGALNFGGKLPIRPDGGVVTQRTANPLPFAENRDSQARKLLTRLAGFRVAFVPSANSAERCPEILAEIELLQSGEMV